jgi:recombination protein RecA
MPKDKDNNTQNAREKNLSIAIKQIEREFGQGSIMRLGESAHQNVPTVSTGALSLDIAGVPRGRVTEIFGPESSGKTTVCLHVIANAQKANGVCAFVDTEHALDPQYAQIIGVNTTDLLVSQPECGEDALNIVETLVRSNAIDVLVIDSVAALVPRAEIEGQMGDTHVGLQARLMSQALRKLTGAINKSRTAVIFTNQIREKVGVMFGSPETTPGGRALKFYASIRLDIRRTATIKSPSGEPLGNRTKVKVVKNKMAPPYRVAEFDIMYAEGVSRSGSILDVALEMKLVDKRGSWFSFDEEQLGQGREQTKAFIDGNPEIQQAILDKIQEQLKDKGVKLQQSVAANSGLDPVADDADVVEDDGTVMVATAFGRVATCPGG